jgi:hypothetical protein
VCGGPVSGVVGDPRIAVPLDFGEGKVGSMVVCRRCASLVRAGRGQEDAQTTLDAMAANLKRGPRRVAVAGL